MLHHFVPEILLHAFRPKIVSPAPFPFIRQHFKDTCEMSLRPA